MEKDNRLADTLPVHRRDAQIHSSNPQIKLFSLDVDHRCSPKKQGDGATEHRVMPHVSAGYHEVTSLIGKVSIPYLCDTNLQSFPIYGSRENSL